MGGKYHGCCIKYILSEEAESVPLVAVFTDENKLALSAQAVADLCNSSMGMNLRFMSKVSV